ncbi:MAG TPA: hypothetical protein VFF03_07885 [Rhodocyclaceae bacterium]|nr:hypothetical protein [Rhodocyclaceae bacterium]
MRYPTTLLLIALAIFLPCFGIALYQEPVDGDLTRIGYLPERQFGWNDPQPVQAVRANGKSLEGADVVVLGDSFSQKNVWQSAFSDLTGARVVTFDYGDIGCFANWRSWLLAQPRLPRLVIVQTVERNLVERFKAPRPCRSVEPRPIRVEAGATAAERPRFPRGGINAAYLFKVLGRDAKTAADGRLATGEVVVAGLDRADLFSSRATGRILYYAGDEDKIGAWTPGDLDGVAATLNGFAAELAGRGSRVAFAVVPDKLTAYYAHVRPQPAPAERYPDSMGLLRGRVAGLVDLKTPFLEAIAANRDLYKPDDTHLSTRGYQLMARTIADSLPK